MAGGISGRAGQTNVKSDPNVVPMIDVMLVLLIIFMIVTPLIAAGFTPLSRRERTWIRGPRVKTRSSSVSTTRGSIS